MRAMVLRECAPLRSRSEPLIALDLPRPTPRTGEVLIRVEACGVCHTELDIIEGRAPPGMLPLIPGHQVVGRVAMLGPNVQCVSEGERVGLAWIFSACGMCDACWEGNENLCEKFTATGRDANGGYAEYLCAPAAFVHRMPETFDPVTAAPLLCAGAVGYRALRLAGVRNGQRLGLTGFGASAHLVLQLVRHHQPDTRVYVFARDPAERAFALELGAHWAGDTMDTPPARLHAAIDSTPAWLPILGALASLERGGRLVINAIRKESGDRDVLLQLDYACHLWQEKEIRTVANVTRADVREFLALAAAIPLRPAVQRYALADANQALRDLREHPARGARVLVP